MRLKRSMAPHGVSHLVGLMASHVKGDIGKHVTWSHQFAFGNWKDYRQQSAFELEEDKKLGTLLLPPELESAVYVFRRKNHHA